MWDYEYTKPDLSGLRDKVVGIIGTRQASDRRDPIGLCLFRGLKHLQVVLQGVLDHVGGVHGLLVEHVGKVRREAGLSKAHEEAVREPAAEQAVERRKSVRPFRAQVQPSPPDDVVARSPGVVGADLEAGGEDHAIQLVLLVTNHDAALRHSFNTASQGVDEGHVGTVESSEVVVVEARPFTELPVVGL